MFVTWLVNAIARLMQDIITDSHVHKNQDTDEGDFEQAPNLTDGTIHEGLQDDGCHMALEYAMCMYIGRY